MMNTQITSISNHFIYKDFIIAPHEICQTCSSPSGPKFCLTSHGDSPIEDMRDNVIPTCNERESRMSTITQVESEIASLEAEISRIQRSLAALQKRRDELQIFTSQQRSILAPIRKLPSNLLEQIFLLWQQAGDTYGLTDVYNRESVLGTAML
ncbi:hypothetical protein BDQ17DRAFT_1412927, partial [Cyathus striatus]